MNMSHNNAAIYIALGANLSNPKHNFRGAVETLQKRSVTIKAVSGLWQSPAWPEGGRQPAYINACAEIEFSGTPEELLFLLHEVEAKFGRKREALNAARTLDLDILDFNGQRLRTAKIEIPHPRMLTRGFVLFPLIEIAPYWCDPRSKTGIASYIARLPLKDIAPMQRIEGRNWL